MLESDLLPRHVISLIFGNLQQLVGVNEELLSELRDRTIGEAFLSVAPYFKLYASYARGHEHALKTLMVSIKIIYIYSSSEYLYATCFHA